MRTHLPIALVLAIGLSGIACRKGKTEAPFRTLPTYRLNGFMDVAGGDLGDKRINDVIRESDVVRAVVLRNDTSATDDLHLGVIARVLRQNPDIRSLWGKEGGALQRLDKFDMSSVFFSALLLTTDEEFVGFHVNREAVRIVASNGDGYVPRE